MAKRRARRQPRVSMVRIPQLDVADAIAALDSCEQLLELLKGVMNGATEWHLEELVSTIQDHVIVSARTRLRRAVD